MGSYDSTLGSPTVAARPTTCATRHGTASHVRWLGHASTEMVLDGTRVVTDPLLRDRIGPLRRHAGTSELGPSPVDAVLISHLHHDHLDLPSIRLLAADTTIVVPRGAGPMVARAARGEVVEVVTGDEIAIGNVTVTAVPAEHSSGRTFGRARAEPLGYVLGGGFGTVYFAGDTDRFAAMTDLGPVDLALLPIWGWGRRLGPGHLDPARAAEAASILRARAVLPVHWGTFAPAGLRNAPPAWLDAPGAAFAAELARTAPDVRLHLVRPAGEPVELHAAAISDGADARSPAPTGSSR